MIARLIPVQIILPKGLPVEVHLCHHQVSPPICSGRVHYKELLVELINRCHGDPAVLFSLAEMKAELQRWNVPIPTRKPDEPEPVYAQRLRMVSDIIGIKTQRV